jgi:hypothetical protein
MADKIILEAEVKSNVGDVARDTKSLASESKKASTGVAGIGTAFQVVGTAIKAAGIGLVVALLAKLMEVFSKNQKVLDFFNIAMETLSIAFNDLFSFLSNNIGTVVGYFKSIFEDPKQSLIDFGTAIKENVIERFNSMLEVFGHLGKALGHLFKGEFAEAFDSVKDAGKESIDVLTGVDDSFDKIKETVTKVSTAIVDYATETLKSAKATIELNKAAELAEVQVQGLIEEYDRQAEKLRQVRDDETKTFAERIEANKKLGEVLKEQGEEMQKLVDIQVHAAQVEFNKNKSQENLIALTQALNEKKAVEAQITGFQSEQLTNQVSLEKELGEVKNELLAEGMSGMQRELQELETSYKLKLEMARKSGMETTAIDAEYARQKEAIVRANVTSQLDAYANLAGALKTLAGENKELAIAEAVISTWSAATKALDEPFPLNFINMAAVIAAGMANISKIMSTDVGTGGGGGGPDVIAPQTPAPQMMQGAFTLGGGIEPEPARAYVVSDDITNNQNKLAIIRRRATI